MLPILSKLDLISEDRNRARGLQPRDYDKQPFGSLGFSALPFPLIPRDEWDERIEERQATKSTLSHLISRAGMKVKNQAQTNYCWINAPVYCLQIVRLLQNQKHVELSPASVGAKIKNFQNVGGWGTEGLKYIAEHGVVPSSLWPDNAIDRKYDTESANAERAKYKASEFWELRPRSLDELATCLLLNFPVAVGYNWWRHEVTAVDLVKQNGQYGILIHNSWGEGWKDKGRGVLLGNEAIPDDAVAPRVAVAS